MLVERAKNDYEPSGSSIAKNCGSAMIMAHFNYIREPEYKKHDQFGLKQRNEEPFKSNLKANQIDFHDAVRKNDITIFNVQGKGYEKDALILEVKSNSLSDLNVVLCKGTIFQHTDWVYKQNLCVSDNTLM